MLKRSGMTLMEMVLTLVLLGILTTSLFQLNEHRLATLRSIQGNTVALYALESAKNHTLLLRDAGNRPIEGSDPAGIFPKKDWKVEWISDQGLVKIRLQDQRSAQKRIYTTEVSLSE